MMFFIVIFSIVALVAIVWRTLFWVYLWQLKEYRLDRLSAQFSGRAFTRLLFPRLVLLKAAVLFGGLGLAFVITPGALGVALLAALALYLVDAGIVVSHGRAGRMRLPVFTLKASATLGLALATEAFLFIVSFRQALSGAGLSESAIALATITLTNDLFITFLSFVLVLLSKLPTAVGRWYLLHKARARRLSFENLLVIGITGSYGKTSTKEFLATILSRHFRVAKVPDHINSDIALACYLLRELNDTHEVLVAEMGAYRQGEIRRLAAVLRPQIGILTGINEQHIALFGGIEKTKAAKYELIESLPEKGLAIFNADSPGSRELYERCDRPKK
ncbi:MAG: Mur ligase family protein, partial [Patescibacteria group bacterium]|nr:Mur ligase family protein [Patescibacteria group bacterium]